MSTKTKKKPRAKKNQVIDTDFTEAERTTAEGKETPEQYGFSSQETASEEARFRTGGSSTATSSDVPKVHQEQGIDIAFCVCDHSLESHDSLGICHIEGCLCTAFELATLPNCSTIASERSERVGHRSDLTIGRLGTPEGEDHRPSNADAEQPVQSPIETFLIALCIQVNENSEGFNADSFIHHLDASGLGRYLQYAKSLIEATQSSGSPVERAKGSWDNWDDEEVQRELNSPEEHLPVDPAAVGPPIGGYAT